MKPKIVIADDSQTTQKVVKIYISKLEEDPSLNFECELIECLNESDLNETLKHHHPALVLLDFNFSENKTGYDLASEIKSLVETKVLMLYGTFDKVDESLFQESGVNSYVVKPFDGVKFLTQLQDLLEESQLDSAGQQESEANSHSDIAEAEGEDVYVSDEIATVVEKSSDSIEIDDEWIVNQPAPEETVELNEDEVVTDQEITSLEAGMADWESHFPPVIGDEPSSHNQFPPVIDEGAEHIRVDNEKEDHSYKEISLDETAGTKTLEEVRALEEQIADEVNIGSLESLGDIWGTDEIKDEGGERVEEESIEFNSKDEIHEEQEKSHVEEIKTETIQISEEDVSDRIERIIVPMVERIVREKVDAIVERVAWDTLPDLAENLIKKELRDIADQVLNSDGA